jgi:plastocyanin
MSQSTRNIHSLQVVAIFAITIIIIGTTQFALAKDDRTELEAELINPSGKDDGTAKFEQRDDRTTFSIEIEDQDENSSFSIKVDGSSLGTFKTDDSGFADFNLDSRDGDAIPSITSGSIIEVIDSNGNVILSGKMIGEVVPQTPGSQPPPTESTPVSTTSVIIPFGAKDKDVSEFYVPSTISVNLGEKITWTNEDDADHTVTSRTNGIFNSGVFGPNQSFSHQFSVDGTYDYFCQLHPWMTGTVVAGKGGDISPSSEPTTPPSTPSASPAPTTSPGSPLTVTIPSGAAEQTITEFYSPSSISINVSDSVLWQNSDIGFHTVTSGKGSPDGLFDSGLFGPSETFSQTFSSSGTFDYFCVVHPWMTGKVVVSGTGSIPTSQPIPSEPTTPTDSQPNPQPTPESKLFEVLIPQGAALQTITEFYSPSNLSINTTDTIIWKNNDEGFHTVTSTEEGGFDSGLYGPAESFSFQFNTSGTFDYFCVVHPWMTGSITVIGQEKTNQGDKSKNILPPLKQMKKGTLAKDVQCKTGYDLIIKTKKELGACVMPASLPILTQRGWGQ